MPEDNLAKEIFDLYENGCTTQSEFVAILMKKDWGYQDAITEDIAKLIWECMDIAAEHYFEDME